MFEKMVEQLLEIDEKDRLSAVSITYQFMNSAVKEMLTNAVYLKPLLNSQSAIDELSGICGSVAFMSLQKAKKIYAEKILQREAELIAYLENGVRDQSTGIYPDWVNEARRAIKHAQDVDWLPELLKVLGWESGSIHDALNAVSRMVEKHKQAEGNAKGVKKIC